jgi:hypothetical protein
MDRQWRKDTKRSIARGLPTSNLLNAKQQPSIKHPLNINGEANKPSLLLAVSELSKQPLGFLSSCKHSIESLTGTCKGLNC